MERRTRRIGKEGCQAEQELSTFLAVAVGMEDQSSRQPPHLLITVPAIIGEALEVHLGVNFLYFEYSKGLSTTATKPQGTSNWETLIPEIQLLSKVAQKDAMLLFEE